MQHFIRLSLSWLAACGSPAPMNLEDPIADPTTDPPREPGAPFEAGERIDVGLADGQMSPEGPHVYAHEVLMPGDLDGDGFGAVLLAGPAYSDRDVVECTDGCPGFERVYVDVIYGGPSIGDAMAASARIVSWHVNALRWRVRTAGDVDGDGRAD